MLKQNQIYFFEVGKLGRTLIKQKYPQAKIFAQPFNPKILPRVQAAEVLCGFTNSDFSAANLRAVPNLKLVVTRSVGYDHIALDYALRRKIAVTNVPDYGAHVIAEHTFALLLASCRNILPAARRVKRLSFERSGLCGLALQGKVLGVVGVGRIGQQVCRIAARGFRMKVLAFDLKPQPQLARENGFTYVKNLAEIWRRAEIISLHTPLTKRTKQLINVQAIRKMRPGVTLINTARGGLIETKALLKALRAGKFFRVALDVLEHEKDLKQERELLRRPEVLVTPHMAFLAGVALEKMYQGAFCALEAYFNNKPLIFRVS